MYIPTSIYSLQACKYKECNIIMYIIPILLTFPYILRHTIHFYVFMYYELQTAAINIYIDPR